MPVCVSLTCYPHRQLTNCTRWPAAVRLFYNSIGTVNVIGGDKLLITSFVKSKKCIPIRKSNNDIRMRWNASTLNRA